MDAPATAPPITYSVNGHQYVSILVGGQAHDDPTRPDGLTSPVRLRGDSIYTFALPGTPLGLSGPAVAPKPAAPAPAPAKKPTTTTPKAAAQATPGKTTVTVGMVEYRFHLSKTTVPAGQVTFQIRNDGKLVHNFDIIGVHAGKIIGPGKSETWTAKLKPGKYSYQCDVPFHAGYGMVGQLIVT